MKVRHLYSLFLIYKAKWKVVGGTLYTTHPNYETQVSYYNHVYNEYVVDNDNN